MAENKHLLNQIYFYLTEECNLKCRHCWITPRYLAGDDYASALDFNLFESIVEQAEPLGLSSVKLTGGEPLLHPRIWNILELIRDKKLILNIETNGVLCTPELVNKIAECNNAFVSVSLDGAEAETHEWVRGVAGCFEAAHEGIQNLVRAGLKPQVIMTVMRRNRDQLEALVRLSESLGAASLKFNVLQPVAKGEKIQAQGEALTIEELVALGRWVDNSLSTSTHLRLHFDHPPAFRPLGKMFGHNGNGCGVCNILGILGVLANGSYSLCGIGEAIPQLIFGHAATDRLSDVWNSTSVLDELREGLPGRLEGACSDCLMKFSCLGGCIAQNYYLSKSLWAPFWYCEAARNAGLFPETRLQAKDIPGSITC